MDKSSPRPSKHGISVQEIPKKAPRRHSIKQVWNIDRIQIYREIMLVCLGLLGIRVMQWKWIRKSWKTVSETLKGVDHFIKLINFQKMLNRHMNKDWPNMLVQLNHLCIHRCEWLAFQNMLIQDISAKEKNFKIVLILLQRELLKPKELKELFVLITEGLMGAHGKYRHLIWLWKVKPGTKEARPPRGFIWSSQFIDLEEMRLQAFTRTLLQSGPTNLMEEQPKAPEWPQEDQVSL